MALPEHLELHDPASTLVPAQYGVPPLHNYILPVEPQAQLVWLVALLHLVLQVPLLTLTQYLPVPQYLISLPEPHTQPVCPRLHEVEETQDALST